MNGAKKIKRHVHKLPKPEDLVDALGLVKAQRAALESEEEKLVNRLKAFGVNEYHGRKYDCAVFEQPRSNVDWWALVKHLKIKARTVSRFTTVNDVMVCKVTARK